MRVGLDVAGVLYAWDEYAREQIEYGDVYGMPEPLTNQQIDALYQPSSHWMYLPEVMGKANWDWFWANQNRLRSYLGPNDYGREHWQAMQDLGRYHEVYLVTDRPKNCWWQTYHWLTQYGEEQPDNLAGVIHTDDKVRIALGLSLDVVVDDRPSQLEQYRDQLTDRALVYGVRRTWNTKLHDAADIYWIDGVADLLKESWA